CMQSLEYPPFSF
nr:immunoglobulin light chain junction region [Macaca mulatta]